MQSSHTISLLSHFDLSEFLIYRKTSVNFQLRGRRYGWATWKHSTTHVALASERKPLRPPFPAQFSSSGGNVRVEEATHDALIISEEKEPRRGDHRYQSRQGTPLDGVAGEDRQLEDHACGGRKWSCFFFLFLSV